MDIPIARGVEKIRKHGLLPFLYAFLNYYDAWAPFWNTVTSRHPIGTNVFDRDWDVLVILDACRVDTLRELSGDFSWLGEVGQMRSVGSTSPEWVLNTFKKDRLDAISETALVTENTWPHKFLAEREHELPKSNEQHKNDAHPLVDSLHSGRPAWEPVRATNFCHYEKITPRNQNDRLHREAPHQPHIVTDRAISVGRTVDFDRLIVWYWMPHISFVADAVSWTPGETTTGELMDGLETTRERNEEEHSYGPVKRGDVSRERMYELYRKNLHLVLEYVDILRRNLDAKKMVISADHGEGLGDGVWGHPHGYPFSPVKTVPWVETTATDERNYEPRYERLDESTDKSHELEILRDMGYITD